jgi:glycosyltransferase involved in cell wall biosynthesis
LKILIVSSTYEPFVVGGAERVAQALARSLTREGHRVAVVTTQPRGEICDREVDGVSVHYLPVRNFYRPFSDYRPTVVAKALWRLVDSYNFSMLPVLRKVIDHEAPDVVNTHNMLGFSVAAWSAADRLDVPIVHTMHDQYLLCHRSTMFKNGRNCSRQCRSCLVMTSPRKQASKHVDVAVGVSRFILDRHTRLGYFQSAESMVIYNTGLIDSSPTMRRPLLGRKLRFGFLGQIIPTKGVHALIDAFLANELLDTELWIAGRGENGYENDLRRRTQAVHNIRWLGVVKPTELFENIDVLVVPSVWHDTAPLVVLEAASHAVPVLGSNRGGIPELIQPSTGWTFDPGDPAALRNTLIHCKQASAQLPQMAESCLNYARQLNSSDWCDQYMRAFTVAIERRRARAT